MRVDRRLAREIQRELALTLLSFDIKKLRLVGGLTYKDYSDHDVDFAAVAECESDIENLAKALGCSGEDETLQVACGDWRLLFSSRGVLVDLFIRKEW